MGEMSKMRRKKLAEKNISGDNYSGTIEMIHVHQNDYFSHLIANDFLPILEDIKNAFLNGYGSGWEDRGKCKIDF